MQFFVAVSASHFAAFFFAVQVLGGLLLLSGFFVPLALTLLGGDLQHPCVPPDDGAGGHRSRTGGVCALGAGLPSVPESFNASSARSLRRGHELRRRTLRDQVRGPAKGFTFAMLD